MEIIDLNTIEEQEVIQKAVSALQDGGLVIYPTETCYGAAVDATSEEAVKKLLEYKTKRNNKALSVAVANQEMAEDYVELNDYAETVYKNFLPGPVTVVSKGKNKVAPFVQNTEGTLGIRIPKYKLITGIVEKLGKPITATSANASYKKTPYSVEDVLNNLSEVQKEKISLILDAGTLPKRKPSVVLNTTLETPEVLRRGDISLDGYETITVKNLEETAVFAEKIYDFVKEDIGKKQITILLNGELGTGKTHFSQFFGKLLGIEDRIKSPTFILANEYTKDFGKIYHLDTYRLSSKEDFLGLEPENMFEKTSIVLMEWANKVKPWLIPYLENSIIVEINLYHEGEQTRLIEYKITQ